MADKNTRTELSIVVGAIDSASQTLSKVKDAVLTIGSSAEIARQSIAQLSIGIVGLGTGTLGTLSQLGGVINTIRGLLSSQVGQQLFNGIKESAEEAFNDVADLSDLLGSIGEVSVPFGKGLFNFKETDIEAKANEVGKRAASAIFRGVSESDSLKSLEGVLSAGLAKGVDLFVQQKLPESLRGFSGVATQVFAPGSLKSLFQGNLFQGAEDLIQKGISDTILSGFRNLDAVIRSSGVKEVSREIGFITADFIVGGFSAARVAPKIQDAIGGGILAGIRAAGNVIAPGVGDIAAQITQAIGQTLNLDVIAQKAIAEFDAPLKAGFKKIAENSSAGTKGIAAAINKELEQNGLNIEPFFDRALIFLNRKAAPLLAQGLEGVLPGFGSNIVKSLLGSFNASGIEGELRGRIKELNKPIQEALSEALTKVELGDNGRSLARNLAAEVQKIDFSAFKKTGARIGDEIANSILPRIEGAVNSISTVLAGGLLDATAEFRANQRIGEDIFSKGLNLNKPIKGAILPILDQIAEEGFSGFLSKVSKTLAEESSGLTTEAGTRIGTALGTSFAQGFATRALASVAQTTNKIDGLVRGVYNTIESIPARLQQGLGAASTPFAALAGFNEPLEVFGRLQAASGGVANSIFRVTQEIGILGLGIDALKQFVQNGPFDMLIGQNVRLREQLLSTQSTLAGTNKIFQGGQQLGPRESIQALEAPVSAALEKVRQGSLELVGVTSGQLVESFQIIAGQLGEIGGSLDNASQLTLDFAATMGTLGIPLYQARQEITSILTAQIDQNSVLAKSLNISNDQVRLYKQQGTLYKELTKRLAVFREGNKLAAQTIGGISSNIQEVFETVTRLAGEPLVQPIVDQLNKVYQYLAENQQAIAAYISQIAGYITKAFFAATEVVGKFIKGTEGIATAIPIYLFKSLANFIEGVAKALDTTLTILQPVINLFAALVQQVGPLGGQFLAVFLQLKVLQSGIGLLGSNFKTLLTILPGLGEGLFLLEQRNNGLINTFVGLRNALGRGGAGFLLFGKYMNSIPGAAGLVASKLGQIGPLVAGFIPQIAGVGIALSGLVKINGELASVISGKLLAAAPVAVSKIAELVGSQKFLGGSLAFLSPQIQKASAQLAVQTKGLTLATLATRLFDGAVKETGRTVAQQVVGFGALAIAVGAIALLIDQFILKNKAVQDALKGLGKFLQSLGGILTNPFVLATTAVIGLSVAIQTGLLPSLIASAREFGKLATTKLADALATVVSSFKNISQSIRNTAVSVREFDFKTFTEGFKKGAEKVDQLKEKLSDLNKASAKPTSTVLADNLKGSADEYSQGLAQRRQRISEIDRQLEVNKNLSPGQRLDQSALLRERSDLTFENDRAKANRKAQIQELSKARTAERIAAAPTERPKSIFNQDLFGGFGQRQRDPNQPGFVDKTNQRLKEFGQAAQQNVSATGTRALGVVQKLTGDGMIRLGEAVGNNTTKFQTFSQKLAFTGSNLYSLGGATINSAQGLGGLGKNLDAANVSFAGIGNSVQQMGQKVQAGAQAAGKGALAVGQAAVGGLKAVSGAVKGLVAEFGPLLLVTAAIAVVAEVFDRYGRITNAAKKSQNEFNAAVAESKQRLDELRNQKFLPPNTGRDLAQERLNEIKKEQNFLSKAIDDYVDFQFGDNSVLGKINPVKALAGLTGNEIKSSRDVQLEAEKQSFGEQVQASSDEANAIARGGAGQGDNKFLDNFKKTQEELLSLRNQRTKAEQEGNAKEVENIDLAIKKAEEEGDVQRGYITSQIEGLRKIQAVTPQQAKDRDQAIKQWQEIQKQVEKINGVVIRSDPIESLRKKLAELEDAFKRFEGTVNLRTKSVEANVAQALKDGQISQDEAAIRTFDSAQDGLREKAEKLQENIEELQAKADEAIKSGSAVPNDIKDKLTALQTQFQETNKQIAEGDLKEENRRIDDAAGDTVRTSKTAEAINQDDLRKQLDEGKISYDEYLKERGEAQESAAANELEAEKQRLFNLQQNENANEDAILESKQKVAQQSVALREKQVEQDNQVVERAAKKAADTVRKTETQRLIDLQKLENKGVISKEEADEQRVKSSQKSVDAQIKAEQAKLKGLKKNAGANEDAIRESEARILDLTKQSVEGQARVQEAYIAKIRKKLEQLALQKELESQKEINRLQKEVVANEALNRALEMRSKLNQAAQEVSSAASGLVTSQLDILSKLETSEIRRKQLAEITAVIKLDALKVQQEYEAESLRIQQEQNRLALERKEIENEIAIAKKKAEIEKGAIDIEIAKEELKNKPGSKTAQLNLQKAILDQQGRQIELGGLEKNKESIAKEKELQPRLEALQNQRQALQFQAQTDQAESEVIANTRNEGLRRRASRAKQEQLSQRAAGVSYRELLNQGGVKVDETLMRLGLTKGPRVGPINAFNPELEDIAATGDRRMIERATAQTNLDFQRQFGSGNQPIIAGPKPGTKALTFNPELNRQLQFGAGQQSVAAQRTTTAVAQDKSSAAVQQKMVDLNSQMLEAQKEMTKSLLDQPGNTVEIPQVNINVYAERNSASGIGDATRKAVLGVFDDVLKKAGVP